MLRDLYLLSQLTGRKKGAAVGAGRSLHDHPIWGEPDLGYIFENNKKWVADSLARDPEYFKKLKNGQKPQYLYIGCADSRVPAQEIMGLKCGEVRGHRAGGGASSRRMEMGSDLRRVWEGEEAFGGQGR